MNMQTPKWLSVTLSFVLVALIMLAYPLTHLPNGQKSSAQPSVQNSAPAETGSIVTNFPDFSYDLTIGGASLHVAIENTDASRQEGLSDTAPLTADQGMLFTFDTPGNLPFWMKDMNYPLDIIWIGPDKTVTYIASDLTASTYPNSYSSPAPAQYVLEVPSGFAAAHNIVEGTQVSF